MYYIGFATIVLLTGLAVFFWKRTSKDQRRINELQRARMLLLGSPNYANDPAAQDVVRQINSQV
jgi:hypothetical protein